MGTCSSCGGELKTLFTSSYCPSCDGETSAEDVGKYYVLYKVPALRGDVLLAWGPYPTLSEANAHLGDIGGYEGVEEAHIVLGELPIGTEVLGKL